MDDKKLADPEIEEFLIGEIFADPKRFDEVRDIVSAGSFYKLANRLIWEAMEELADRGETIDVALVATRLKESGKLNMIPDGMSYLQDIIMGTPGDGRNAIPYAKTVRGYYLRRLLVALGRKVQNDAFDMDRSLDEVVDGISSDLLRLVSQNVIELPPVKEVILETMEKIEKAMRGERSELISGFPSLDLIVGGWNPGDYLIIAGLTSSGKTAFSLNLSYNVARMGKRVLYFSTEMIETQLMMRLFAIDSGVSLQYLKTGALDEESISAVALSADRLANFPLHIIFAAGKSIPEIKGIVKRAKIKYSDLALVVVDYIQQLSLGRSVESRQREVSEISRQLKLLAMEAQVVLLGVSQMNRAIAHRANPEPVLSDLRESGSLEQDSDFVGFLYQPDEEDLSMVEFLIRKHRNGSLGRIGFRFERPLGKFKEVKIGGAL